MRVLLLGASGYFGTGFAEELERRCITPVVISHRDFWSIKTPKLDGAQLVINCAAFITRPSVDFCEDHKVECVRGNLLFPVRVCQSCERFGIPLIHLSTGCLYNGENGGWGWSENDAPQLTFDTGAGMYVSCKEIAERIISQYDKAYCLRIRLPFDNLDDPRNLLTKLQTYPEIVDETQSITHRRDFVDAALDLWEKQAPFGVYNCTSPGHLSYRNICERINKILYNGRKEFRFISTEEFDKRVARTIKSRCVLSVKKLADAGIKMRPVDDAIDDSLRNWKPCITTSNAAGPADPRG